MIRTRRVGGKISNLGDAWEQLKVTIGKSQTGIISSTTSWSTNLINQINNVEIAKNKLDIALKGTPETTYEKIGQNIAFLGGGQSIRDIADIALQTELQSKYITPSTKDIAGATKAEKELFSTMAGIMDMSKKDYESTPGKVGRYERDFTIIANAFKEISENKISLINQPKLAAAEAEKKRVSDAQAAKKASEKETVRENITINISKLVETLEVHAVTLKEGTQEIKDIIAETLTQAVMGIKLTTR